MKKMETTKDFVKSSALKMGITFGKEHVLSRNNLIKNNSPQLYNHLTEDQIKIVQTTWQLIKPNMAEIGVVIFKRLISTHQDVCKVFKKFVIVREDGTTDWDSDALQRHALLVMQALEAAIENIADTNSLSNLLQSLGCKHNFYHVQETMFDKMWLALFYGLKSRIKMDIKTRDAWFRVFRFLACKIIEGMRKAKYEIQQPNTTHFTNYNQIA